MTASEAEAAAPKRRPGRLGLVLGLIAALALGGGGFFVIHAGLIDPGRMLGGGAARPAAVKALDDIGFVALEPIVVSLAPGGPARHLRFVGQLEVVPEHAEEVIALMPRIQDVLNTYLRAVEVRDLEQPAATVWLRAQMLRRIQVVTGEGRVRDLLIAEFVMS